MFGGHKKATELYFHVLNLLTQNVPCVSAVSMYWFILQYSWVSRLVSTVGLGCTIFIAQPWPGHNHNLNPKSLYFYQIYFAFVIVYLWPYNYHFLASHAGSVLQSYFTQPRQPPPHPLLPTLDIKIYHCINYKWTSYSGRLTVGCTLFWL